MAEDGTLDLGLDTTPADETAAPPPPPPRQDVVPHAALHEQRELNKSLKVELTQTREKMERMEGTFQRFLATANEKPAPKFDEDPLGHFQAENAALKDQLEKINSQLSGFQKNNEQASHIQALAGAIVESEQEFRQTNADYDAAVAHVKQTRREELKDLGYSGAEIKAILDQEILALGDRALKAGKSPAEVAYQMAKRYGFKGEKVEDNKIATLAKGMEMSKTVQGGRGGGISLEDLAKLPDDQVDAIMKDEKKFQALIRGQMIQ